jgi:hypothetical protein
LVDRIDLFKNSNLVLGGKAIVTSLYSSLERTETGTERERKREREPVGQLQDLMRYDTGNNVT